jgi:hypothetical protein
MMDNQDIALMLVRIDSNTEATKVLLEKHIEDDEKVQGDHESRLRGLEKKMWAATGVTLLIVAAGGWGLFA